MARIDCTVHVGSGGRELREKFVAALEAAEPGWQVESIDGRTSDGFRTTLDYLAVWSVPTELPSTGREYERLSASIAQKARAVLSTLPTRPGPHNTVWFMLRDEGMPRRHRSR